MVEGGSAAASDWAGVVGVSVGGVGAAEVELVWESAKTSRPSRPDSSCCHVSPPLVEVKTPPKVLSLTMPAYRRSGLVRSTRRASTLRPEKPVFEGAKEAPASLLA